MDDEEDYNKGRENTDDTEDEIVDNAQDEIEDADADTEDIISESENNNGEIIARIDNIEKMLDSIMQKFNAFATDARIADSGNDDSMVDLVVDKVPDYRDFDLSI